MDRIRLSLILDLENSISRFFKYLSVVIAARARELSRQTTTGRLLPLPLTTSCAFRSLVACYFGVTEERYLPRKCRSSWLSIIVFSASPNYHSHAAVCSVSPIAQTKVLDSLIVDDARGP